MKDEIKEILNKLRSDDYYKKEYQKSIYYERDLKKLEDYITNLQEKIEYNDLVLKALHRYFTEHECYEINEFLRQLENCTENDIIWLKRMAGEEK